MKFSILIPERIESTHSSVSQYLGASPKQPSANIHLLHDTVHLFKSIRNNWITEKSGTLKLIFEGSQYIGKWSDIIKLYECEKGDMIRRTKLSHAAVYPGPIDHQKVSLMTQVFDEKNSCGSQNGWLYCNC